MDLQTYRIFQDSGWVRAQREQLQMGRRLNCPARECAGELVEYEVMDPSAGYVDGLPPPGGVRCPSCGLTSRAVAM